MLPYGFFIVNTQLNIGWLLLWEITLFYEFAISYEFILFDFYENMIFKLKY